MQWLRSTALDARYAARRLRKNPGVTFVIILTLALGIGSVTAIFSVAYTVLLRPLPYPNSDRIVAIFEITTRGTPSRLADPNFDDFRDHSRSFQTIAKYSSATVSVSGALQPTRTTVAAVTPDFFRVLGVRALIGRGFEAPDNRLHADPVAVVSYGYWRQWLAGSSDISQAHLRIGNSVYSVVGVMPAGFQFPTEASVWIPADRDGENESRTSHNYLAIARLLDNVTIGQANADLSAIAQHIHDGSSVTSDYLLKDARVTLLQESITGKARTPLLVLLVAVGFLLLVACANVANVLLAQALARARELAVCNALGAQRSRIVKQFLVETFLLVSLGGTGGVLATLVGVRGIIALAPANLPRLDEVAIRTPVLAFAFLVSATVAIGLGVFTAVRATAGGPRQALVEAGRGLTTSPSNQRVGQMIVAAQMAITLVLAIGAGLLGRSLLNVLAVNPGFRTDNILSMDVSLPSGSDYAMGAGRAQLLGTLIERLTQVTGIRKVGAVNALPLNEGGLPDGMFLIAPPSEAPKTFADLGTLLKQAERRGTADYCVTTRGYFETLGIPLVRGRLFDERDSASAAPVALISESLATEKWPGQDPLSRTIEFGNMDGDLRLLTIVGIVGDVHDYGVDAPPRPTVYVDLRQRQPRPDMTIVMLTEADTQQITSAARGILHELDPNIPPRFRTFSQVYSASLGSRRFNVILIGVFGAAALLLAMAGVFGVTAYAVSRRTREIGVRVALGADSRAVFRMVLGQSIRTTLSGVTAGVLASLALTRSMQSLLFGVTATDPITFAGVIIVLVCAALAACCVPARRAMSVDPMVALRGD